MHITYMCVCVICVYALNPIQIYIYICAHTYT